MFWKHRCCMQLLGRENKSILAKTYGRRGATWLHVTRPTVIDCTLVYLRVKKSHTLDKLINYKFQHENVCSHISIINCTYNHLINDCSEMHWSPCYNAALCWENLWSLITVDWYHLYTKSPPYFLWETATYLGVVLCVCFTVAVSNCNVTTTADIS